MKCESCGTEVPIEGGFFKFCGACWNDIFREAAAGIGIFEPIVADSHTGRLDFGYEVSYA